MSIRINQVDDRIPFIGESSLAESFSALVETDTQAGNVSVGTAEWRQIVNTNGRYWVIKEAPHRANRPGLDQAKPMTPRDAPIFFDNVLAKKQQSWVTLTVEGIELVALTNPNPHLPYGVTLAWRAPERQTWNGGNFEETRARVGMITTVGAALAERLPGSVLGYNNLDAGPSLPQLHLNLGSRPAGMELFPIEGEILSQAAQNQIHVFALDQNREYPAPAVIVRGTADSIADALSSAVLAWATEPGRTGNLMFLGPHHGQPLTGVFWPRVSTWQRAPGFRSGAIAFCELAGLFVVSHPSDIEDVERGAFDYRHFWRVLRSTVSPIAREFGPKNWLGEHA